MLNRQYEQGVKYSADTNHLHPAVLCKEVHDFFWKGDIDPKQTVLGGGEDAFASERDIIEKFKKLSRATMSEPQQADLIDMILNMESLPDMRALPEALRTA